MKLSRWFNLVLSGSEMLVRAPYQHQINGKVTIDSVFALYKYFQHIDEELEKVDVFRDLSFTCSC